MHISGVYEKIKERYPYFGLEIEQDVIHNP